MGERRLDVTLERTLTVALALLGVACGDGPASSGLTGPGGTVESAWEVLPASPSATGRHDDIFFAAPDTGWLASNDGRVYGTTDGGATWPLLTTLEQVLPRAIGFADPKRGWLGNLNFTNVPIEGRALFQTSDGGVTWDNITSSIVGPEAVGICGIQVLDSAIVVAVGRWNGPAVFARTDDGGANWWSVDMAPLATGLVDVHFFDTNHGLAVGGRGVGSSPAEQRSSRTVVLATSDGGRTWTERWLDEHEGTWAWKVTFPTPEVGFISIQGPEADGFVLRTRDGGATWQEVRVADGAGGFSGIGFATPLVGWVAGSTVHRTLDGGDTWREAPFGADVNRFRFLAPDVGFASGRRVYRLKALP